MKRTSKKKQSKPGRLRLDMIGSPQDDLKHTVHVGIDGAFFGDVSFLHSNAQEATFINKKIEKYHQLPRRSSLKRPSLDLSGRGSPLLEKTLDASKPGPASEHNGSDSTSEDHTDNRSADSPALHSHKQDHEYNEISDEKEECNHKIKDFRLSTFDLGPSLMDEVFKALGDTSRPSSLDLYPASPLPLTPTQQQQTTALLQDNDTHIHNVKQISPTDECSIDSAIDMANELASKSILELDNLTVDSSVESDGPDSSSLPSSPTEHGSIFYVQ